MTDLSSPDVERERYWNEEYVRYWKARVAEANKNPSESSILIAGDAKTSNDAIYNDAIALLEIQKSETVLELGCGFGRSLPILCQQARLVHAVDISKEMIAAAKEVHGHLNVGFHVAPSEKLPLENGIIDVVVCFAVFDATYQRETLIEINRVCKPGARVLVTGKNDNYNDDDNAALEAEIGARQKKHPNYFTDTRLLLGQINAFGFSVEKQRFFPKRGDFSQQNYQIEIPEYFYEYLIVLKKRSACQESNSLAISDMVSKTYLRLKHI